MSREKLVKSVKDYIKDDVTKSWWMMNGVAGIFEELCIPGDAFPDDEIMKQSQFDVESAMWAYILSVHGEAERGGKYSHTYEEAIALTLIATADALDAKPGKKKEAAKFKDYTGFTPTEFLDEFTSR